MKIPIALTGLLILSTPVLRADDTAEIRTPAAPHTPRINGPAIFGVRPGSPFLYHIPATGDRPMAFSADNLPEGLHLDPATGNITGVLAKQGEFKVVFHAKNTAGTDDKKFRIIVGDTIALTPAMGWNSWNHYAGKITGQIVLENAKAMVSSGLIDHGWTYVNIDDTWQGKRGGEFKGIQGNKKFPDIKALCDEIHAMGLKFGIYSTPWMTSYADFPGGSANNAEGDWKKSDGKRMGEISFAANDAKQFGAWGVDYLKYDWNPILFPETKAMGDALNASGRDILYSLSNSLNIKNGPTIGKISNSWRTTGDIKANWKSMTGIGFKQDKWRPFAAPGHWNDPDMLEIATKEGGQPGLTPNEEYTHMSLWCLLHAPLLLACDMAKMDDFTRNLVMNDEIIALDQDELGDQAVTVAKTDASRVYAKTLADGSKAVGLFNTGDAPQTVAVKWSDIKFSGEHAVRDAWRQKDLGKFTDGFSMTVAPHGAEVIKVSP